MVLILFILVLQVFLSLLLLLLLILLPLFYARSEGACSSNGGGSLHHRGHCPFIALHPRALHDRATWPLMEFAISTLSNALSAHASDLEFGEILELSP